MSNRRGLVIATAFVLLSVAFQAKAADAAAPEFLREMKAEKQFAYQPGGGDPMAAPEPPVMPPEPEPEEPLQPAPEPVDAKPEAPSPAEPPLAESAAGIVNEFIALGLRVDGVVRSSGSLAALVNGGIYSSGDVLVKERSEGDLTIESIEPDGVLFRFKNVLIHIPPPQADLQ